jgi:hypothetical protein
MHLVHIIWALVSGEAGDERSSAENSGGRLAGEFWRLWKFGTAASVGGIRNQLGLNKRIVSLL